MGKNKSFTCIECQLGADTVMIVLHILLYLPSEQSTEVSIVVNIYRQDHMAGM